MPKINYTAPLPSHLLDLFDNLSGSFGSGHWQARQAFEDIDLGKMLHQALYKYIMSKKDKYAPPERDSGDIVDGLYLEFFGRDADPEGRLYWTERLDAGESIDNVRHAMLESAGDKDLEAHLALREIASFHAKYVDPRYDTPPQPLFQQGLRSNEEFYAELARLDKTYATLDLAQAGESLDGNPLYRAVVGDGPQTLMIVTQQHGDEPTATEAAMYLLEFMSGDSPMAQALREEVTLVVMPRVNPDGFDRWEALISGEAHPDETIIPRRNSADIDLNRAYDPDNPLDPDLVPEFLAVQQVLNEFQPDLFLDYHNQNNYLNEDGLLDTMSIMWPTNPDVDPAITAVAQQAALAVAASTGKFDYSNLSLFPGGDDADIARNGLALQDTPILLVEQRGLEEMQLAAFEGLDYDHSGISSALILESVISMMGVISGMADGSLAEYDPEDALLIAERGERIPYDEIYEQVEYELEGVGMDAMLASMDTADTSPAYPADTAFIPDVEAELLGLDEASNGWEMAA